MLFERVTNTGVILTILAILIFLRNICFPTTVLATYPLYPFRMNGNLTRISNSYFASKGSKSFKRMLFFNLIRCMVPELLKEFIFKGKLVVWEFTFVFCCACVYTILYHFLPISVFARFRYVYGYLQLEYYCKHASDWIDNRNQLELLQSHNFCAFWLFVYLESNSMLTAAMFEGLVYGEMTVWDLPYTIYDGAFNYIVAIPLTYLLQVMLLGAAISLHVPSTIAGLWWQKSHLTGWVHVDLGTEEYDLHWVYHVIFTGVFIGLSGYYDVYRRIFWLSEYRAKQREQAAVDKAETRVDEAVKKNSANTDTKDTGKDNVTSGKRSKNRRPAKKRLSSTSASSPDDANTGKNKSKN